VDTALPLACPTIPHPAAYVQAAGRSAGWPPAGGAEVCSRGTGTKRSFIFPIRLYFLIRCSCSPSPLWRGRRPPRQCGKPQGAPRERGGAQGPNYGRGRHRPWYAPQRWRSGRSRRLEDLAVHVEAPAVITAPNPLLGDQTKLQRGAAMRTVQL
jgi:hypothetical protein